MRIKISDSNKAKVIQQKSEVSTISPDTIASSLGAEKVSDIASQSGEMFTMAKLFQSAVEKVRSKGGRPGRVGNIERKKIPITTDEWLDLEKISMVLHSFDIHVSTGQVAALLIENSIQNVKNSLSGIQEEVDKEVLMAAKSGEKYAHIQDVKEFLKKELIKDKLIKIIPGLTVN